MRKVLDGSFIALCILTMVNMDYANIGPLDIAVLACIGVALASAVVLFFVRKGKRDGREED